MYMPNALYRRFGVILNALRWGYGCLLFLAGLDKLLEMTNTNWTVLISPALEMSLPLKLSTILIVMSSVQMIIGLMLLVPGLARLGAYLGALFLFLLSTNLFAAGFHFYPAFLNIMLAIGMLVLGQLLAIKAGMRDAAV